MKSSNVLLGLWFLVVMGLAFAAVWFLVRREGPGDGYGKPTAQSPVAGGGGASGNLPKPPRPPRTPGRGEQKPAPQPVIVGGRVVDLEGKGVAGARVRVLPPSKPVPPPAQPDLAEVRRVNSIVDVPVEEWNAPRPLAAWSEVADPADGAPGAASTEFGAADSGADGRFEIPLGPAVGRGPFRVVARSETLGSAGASGVMAGQDVELLLAAGGVVTGQVVSDARSGPVVGARVVFDSGERRFSAVADDSGNFRIEGMSPGRYVLRAGAKGYTPLLDRSITVVRDQPVVVKLPRGVTLRVRAILDDESGAESPVRNAEIVAMNEDTYAYVIGRTDDQGVVEFEGLPAGRWVVNGRAEGLISSGEEAPVLVETGAPFPCDVYFEPAVTTPLTVVDADGQPVAGMEFYTANGEEEYDVLLSDKLPGATDALGQFGYAFEFAGRRSMIFGFRKGYGLVRAYPDDNTSGDPLRLVAKKAVRVHGRVITPKGEPIADAMVLLTIEPPTDGEGFDDSMILRIRTGPDGRYDFPYLPADCEVTVEAETADGGWSEDAPVIDPAEGKTDHPIDLTIDESPEPRMILGGQGPQTPPK